MRTLAIACLALVAAPAHADRYARGQLVYETACVTCHSLGWKGAAPEEKGRVDLSRVADLWSSEQLRRFIDNPTRERKDSGCHHQALGRDQIEDVISFFRTRAGSPPVRPKTPPRSNNPQAAPRPAKPKSSAGGSR